jgi:hypothetical protein
VAGEAEDFVDIANTDDWPLIIRMAELVAMTMVTMHRACIREALKGAEPGANPDDPLWPPAR